MGAHGVKPTGQTAAVATTMPVTPDRGEDGKPFVGPEDLKDFDPAVSLAQPSEYPFTRGIHREMYRKRLWTMRQFAGFGSAQQTNERFKYLLAHGQTGLSTAFDLPTLMGRDSDDLLSLGEVGRCGVAISSLDDMRRLFDGIDLGQVSTSMTINAPAAILLAFYIAVAKEQGVPLDQLRGTLQNDILKEFHSQNEYVFPPPPSVRLVIDTIEYGTQCTPQWNTVSISGYHIREAGATAAQELAFTLADGMAYVEESIKRGLDVDAVAKRLSFFFDVHNDFFEEIAKFRAARRIWAKVMRHKYKAKNERSWWLRTHAQTAGVSLTEQQPMNNVVRVAYQALAAVLGGTQSLHTNSYDETLALPSENAVKVALRTQQVLAYETNVTQIVDPLGGSYFIEKLTDEIEAKAEAIFKEIDAMGGVLPAIDRGYFRRAIAESALQQAREYESGQAIMVGVNKFREEQGKPIEILQVDQATEDEQVARLKELKKNRDAARHKAALEKVRQSAGDGENMMPSLIEAAEADATVGEMMATMQTVFGSYDGGPEW
ncbi:MAG: methylmalonyl-CoA mutase [Phycisphaerae bacterium]|nr:methylmalonyl-CoA mutase [Phycisphaerae bacterium]